MRSGNEHLAQYQQQAETFLDALSAAGSPALQQAIADERARRPLGPMAGMTFDEAWAYLNELGRPGAGCRR
ncbi:MAG: hypothetical protein ACP5HM_15370 [Anaerolineae bacterium]